MMKWLLAVVLATGLGYNYWKSHRPIQVEPPRPVAVAPVDEREPPIQKNLSAGPVFAYNGYKVTAIAEFSVGARVILAKHYSNDRESDLAPVDLALGWGPMANPRVLDRFSFSQSGRFYRWTYSGESPLPRREIETNSANMHLIPDSKQMEKRLKSVRAGDQVRIRGYLVTVEAPDGWHWRSSTTREDTGGGACELIFVQELDVL